MVKNNKEELIKLIKENPDLPLVFFAYNGDFCPDYGGTVFNDFYTYIDTIYIDEQYDSIYYANVEDIIDIWRDRLCDKEEYKDLSDEEYDKTVEKYVEENVEHYDAIVVNMRI
ncbi:MAG: hypothetical protein ACLTPN_02470 [Clostridia bacterium]